VIIRLEPGSRWLAARIGDFEKWQAGLLEESASRLGAVLDPGGRVHRYGFVGSPVTFCGQRAWLRVSPFLEHEMSRKAWHGTAEAAVISGVSKPALLHRIEWHADGPEPVPVSAEVLKDPGTRGPRTHSGPRRPAIVPRTAYALFSGTSLGQEERVVTVGSAYVGSNPTPATTCENAPLAANSRAGGAFLLCPFMCHLVAL